MLFRARVFIKWACMPVGAEAPRQNRGGGDSADVGDDPTLACPQKLPPRSWGTAELLLFASLARCQGRHCPVTLGRERDQGLLKLMDRLPPFALTGARWATTLCALLKQRQPGVEARSRSFDQKQPACSLSSSGMPMGGRTRGAQCSPVLHRSSNPRFGRPPDWKRMCDC